MFYISWYGFPKFCSSRYENKFASIGPYSLGLQKLNFDATLSVIIPVDIKNLYMAVMEEARNTRRLTKYLVCANKLIRNLTTFSNLRTSRSLDNISGDSFHRTPLLWTLTITETKGARHQREFPVCLYSKGFEPGSDSRSCSVIVRVRVVLKRTFSFPEPSFLLVTWSAKRRALVAATTGCREISDIRKHMRSS